MIINGPQEGLIDDSSDNIKRMCCFWCNGLDISTFSSDNTHESQNLIIETVHWSDRICHILR